MSGETSYDSTSRNEFLVSASAFANATNWSFHPRIWSPVSALVAMKIPWPWHQVIAPLVEEIYGLGCAMVTMVRKWMLKGWELAWIQFDLSVFDFPVQSPLQAVQNILFCTILYHMPQWTATYHFLSCDSKTAVISTVPGVEAANANAKQGSIYLPSHAEERCACAAAFEAGPVEDSECWPVN